MTITQVKLKTYEICLLLVYVKIRATILRQFYAKIKEFQFFNHQNCKPDGKYYFLTVPKKSA